VIAGWREVEGEEGLGIEAALLKEIGKVRSPETGYSLGWKVMKRNGKAVLLSHSGSLQSYRAWIGVDLEKGISVAGCWTLGETGKDVGMRETLGTLLEVR
jgi:hypothetical protein